MARREAARAYARMGAGAKKIQMKTGVNAKRAKMAAMNFGKGDYMDKRVKDKQPGVGQFKIQRRKDPQRKTDRKAIDRLKDLRMGMGMDSRTIGGMMGMGMNRMGMGMGMQTYQQKVKEGDFDEGTGQDFGYDEIEVPVEAIPEFNNELAEVPEEEENWEDWLDPLMIPWEEEVEMPDPTVSVGSDAGISATGVVLGGRRRARTAGAFQFNRDYVPQRNLNLASLGINV